MKDFNLDLHLVTDRGLSCGRPLLEIVRAAVAGGVSVVQLREKDCSIRDFLDLGRAVAAELKGRSVPLIINDRVDIALAIGADGVHLGQSDMPYKMARMLLGPEALIGLSVESVADALAAEHLDVAYLGISPVYSTATKTDLKQPLGLDGIRDIQAISRHRLVAIGGIHAKNTRSILDAGAHGVAVVSAICSAADPAQAARQIRLQISAARQKQS
jgi:thiamine-phosphate pyrophosphorylase